MLRTTHTSSVTEDQIDHLGHMNVRFYLAHAYTGTRAMLEALPGWAGPHRVHDFYTRHHREQLLGSPLVVRSAILGADADGVRLHHELANADTGELAATFVHVVLPLGEDGEPAHLPDELLAVANAEAMPAPDYAATRTISLDVDLLEEPPSLEVLQERDLAMRKERLVPAEECDELGRYRVELAPMLSWGGEPVEGQQEELLYTLDDDVVMGWAVMESRWQFGRLPRLGDRIQSYAATVAVHDKVIHRVHWAFDLDRRDLVLAYESVSLAFDTGARRPIAIPPRYRARQLEIVQPDLAPR
ncbi:MAG: thioesterase family protein [Actinomycetota bacterium]|nr:thioesterase family protein [Actinomycetota bacterium]